MKRHKIVRSLTLPVILLFFITSVTSFSLKAQPFVFSQTISGKEIVFTASGDFSYVRQLVGEDTSWWDPCFSPDGEYLAYFRGEPGTAMDLWTVYIGYTGLKRLTHLGTKCGRHPSWHPNGNKILYEAVSMTDKYESEIRIVNTDGTNDTILFDNAGDKDRFPCINPSDTNKVVYHYDPGNWEYFSQIRIRDLSSGQDEILVDNNGWADGMFSFSPDGKMLLWSERENGDEMRLRTINLTTRSINTISTVKGPFCYIEGVYDQTGMYIFYIRRSVSAATDVIRCNADGTSPVVLYTADSINSIDINSNIPVANYPFNGNADDLSGYGNNGLIFGASSFPDKCDNPDQAYSFNGINNYISVPHNPVFNFRYGDFTMYAHIQDAVAPAGSWSAILSKHNSSASPDNEFFLRLENDGRPAFGLNTSQGENEIVYGPESVCNMGNKFLCGVRENGEIKLYIDGILTGTAPSVIDLNNNNSLNIGRSSYNNGYGYYNGVIHRVLIYPFALSESEVHDLFIRDATSTCTTTIIDSANLAVEWLLPSGNPECGTTKQDSVKVRIKNHHWKSANSYDLSYSVDGGQTFFSETVYEKILPHDSIDYTFTKPADMSDVKTYSCSAIVTKEGDFDLSNNISSILVQNNRIQVTVEAEMSICNQATGGARVTGISNGVAPYIYSWSGGQTADNITDMPVGIYNVTVTDSRSCSWTESVFIDETGEPVISDTVINNISCYGRNDGAIDITIMDGTSPLSYEWSNGSITEDIDNLAPGIYEINITDQAGCKKYGSYEVLQPTPLYLTISSTNSSSDTDDGSAEVIVSGGTPPYEYLWTTTGNTNSLITALASGTYSAVITDANGCKDSISAKIFQLCGPDIVVSSVTPSACGLSNGMIDISIPGDTGQFVYVWSNGEMVQDLISVPSGDYGVMVAYKDSICASVATITVPALLDPVPICMVSVDTLTGHNVVIWQKPVFTGDINAFNIYRETDRYEVYEKIGTRTIQEESFFVDADPIVNPAIQPWKYKMSVTDTCGNESDLSAIHKTMHLLMNEGLGNTVNLIWDNYSGFDYYTCHIYRYSPQDGLQNIFNKAGSPQLIYNSFTDLTPPETDTYYYFIEIESPYTCTSQKKATSHNSVRSNKTNKISSTGIYSEPPENLRNLSLYPNPNNGTFALSLELEKADDIVFKIYDSYGRLLLYREAENIAGRYTEEINLADKSPGIYHLQIIMNDGVITRPFVIE